jgi:Hydrolase of X-linked nucleoside diphosphate N terminal
MSTESAAIDAQLARWSETLSAIARTGLAFTQNLYERERYEEVLHVAADIKASLEETKELRREQRHFVQEWMDNIGEGIPGYVTPKVAVGAIVGGWRDFASEATREWRMAVSHWLGRRWLLRCRSGGERSKRGNGNRC